MRTDESVYVNGVRIKVIDIDDGERVSVSVNGKNVCNFSHKGKLILLWIKFG